MPKDHALPNVPRWARRSALGAALTNVPSAVWRIAIAVGLPVGLGRSEYEQLHAPGWGSFYLVGLSLVSEFFAFLALGLVRPWGEVWPRWMPWLGGRRVPVLLATTLAALGAVAATVFGVLFVLTSLDADMDTTAWGRWLLNAVYAPLLLWGPLLAAVTVHYHRRRTAAPEATDQTARARVARAARTSS
ncbi:hypothetical protein [Streptomyces sp. NPDC049555]|uniref:hypothetical protein n=1 Tax=unclassified Streptomyces TaxID=2593676 RepID=UPI0034181317